MNTDYSIVFEHLDQDTQPLQYSAVRIECVLLSQSATDESWTPADQLIEDRLVTPALKRQDERTIPGRDWLIDTFTSLALDFQSAVIEGAGDDELAQYLAGAFAASRIGIQEAHPRQSTRELQILFTSYLTHLGFTCRAAISPIHGKSSCRGTEPAGNSHKWQNSSLNC